VSIVSISIVLLSGCLLLFYLTKNMVNKTSEYPIIYILHSF